MGSTGQNLAKTLYTIVTLLLIFGTALAEINTIQVQESRFTSVESTRGVIYWGLMDATKTRTCILLSGQFDILIPYDTDYFSTVTATIPVPRNASVNGFCDSETSPNLQSMTLTWTPDPDLPELEHSLTFTFRRKDHSGEGTQFQPYYELVTIQGIIHTNEIEFPEAFYAGHIYNVTASKVEMMTALESLSYFCKSPEVIGFDDGENFLRMSLVRAEAFHKRIAVGDGNDFGPKSFCVKDGFDVILKVLGYLIILALIGLAVFYIMDNRSKKRSYIYL